MVGIEGGSVGWAAREVSRLLLYRAVGGEGVVEQQHQGCSWFIVFCIVLCRPVAPYPNGVLDYV